MSGWLLSLRSGDIFRATQGIEVMKLNCTAQWVATALENSGRDLRVRVPASSCPLWLPGSLVWLMGVLPGEFQVEARITEQ